MLFKARQFYNRCRKTPKMQSKKDWSDYSKKMKMWGDITIWLPSDVIDQWTIMHRQYDGSGTPDFSLVDIVILPRINATDDKHHHWMRNRNFREIKCCGRMKWQNHRAYGKRNQSEGAICRYKKILGDRLHSREFECQRQEAIID